MNIIREPFDLPSGYMLGAFVEGGYAYGISPEGVPCLENVSVR